MSAQNETPMVDAAVYKREELASNGDCVEVEEIDVEDARKIEREYRRQLSAPGAGLADELNEARLVELERQIRLRDEDRIRLQAEVNLRDEQLSELRDELKAENAALRDEISLLYGVVESRNENIASIRDELLAVTRKAEAAESERDALRIRDENASTEIARIRAESAEQTMLIDALRREVSALRSDVEHLHQIAAGHLQKREAAERELAACREDAKRLNYFEDIANKGGCPALLFDDNGHWAVAHDGTQNFPMEDGPVDIQTTFFVEANRWHETPREAIDAAIKAARKV